MQRYEVWIQLIFLCFFFLVSGKMKIIYIVGGVIRVFYFLVDYIEFIKRQVLGELEVNIEDGEGVCG